MPQLNKTCKVHIITHGLVVLVQGKTKLSLVVPSGKAVPLHALRFGQWGREFVPLPHGVFNLEGLKSPAAPDKFETKTEIASTTGTLQADDYLFNAADPAAQLIIRLPRPASIHPVRRSLRWDAAQNKNVQTNIAGGYVLTYDCTDSSKLALAADPGFFADPKDRVTYDLSPGVRYVPDPGHYNLHLSFDEEFSAMPPHMDDAGKAAAGLFIDLAGDSADTFITNFANLNVQINDIIPALVTEPLPAGVEAWEVGPTPWLRAKLLPLLDQYYEALYKTSKLPAGKQHAVLTGSLTIKLAGLGMSVLKPTEFLSRVDNSNQANARRKTAKVVKKSLSAKVTAYPPPPTDPEDPQMEEVRTCGFTPVIDENGE